MLAADEQVGVKEEVEIDFSPLHRPYTLEEFWSLPEPENRSHYELIGGVLFMASKWMEKSSSP
jgi:hypothetical protein